MSRTLRQALLQYKVLVALGVAVLVFFGGLYTIESVFGEEIPGAFKFSSAKKTGPVFDSAVVDPSDVKVGDTQSFKVNVSDPEGIVSVMAITRLDTSIREITLQSLTGDDVCTNCTWEGTWKVNDTSNRTYQTRLVATNGLGEKNSVTISWTDPCSAPLSGSWALDGNCQISITDGLEEGVFTVPSDKTLTVLNGGTWVYQEGYPISIIGTIAIQEGGKLVRSLLWVTDSDGDGYAPASGTQVASLTQPSAEYVRRKAITGFGDCYDASTSAYPGQTTYFTAHRGDGSYDYNCSGGEDKYYPTSSSGTCYSCGKGGCSGAPGWSPGGIPSCGETRTYYTDSSCNTQSRTQSCR